MSFGFFVIVEAICFLLSQSSLIQQRCDSSLTCVLAAYRCLLFSTLLKWFLRLLG